MLESGYAPLDGDPIQTETFTHCDKMIDLRAYPSLKDLFSTDQLYCHLEFGVTWFHSLRYLTGSICIRASHGFLPSSSTNTDFSLLIFKCRSNYGAAYIVFTHRLGSVKLVTNVVNPCHKQCKV